MSDQKPKMTFSVDARRVDAHGSLAHHKSAEITLDTDLEGRADAFNPAELLMAAVAACMIKGIERVTPILKFDLSGVQVRLHGVRQDTPPRMESIDYEILNVLPLHAGAAHSFYLQAQPARNVAVVSATSRD